MAWFNADDKMHSHPKSRAAGLEAIGLWTLAGTYSAAHGPHGHIGESFVSSFRRGKRLAQLLVEAELWERVPGGWNFTDMWKITQRTREPIPYELRLAVYERDGFKCKACGKGSDLTLDHIWPWSLFGADTYENLQTLCKPCNSRKGAKVGEGYPPVLHPDE
jgi:GNAT superfamily N-acetyltransferase